MGLAINTFCPITLHFSQRRNGDGRNNKPPAIDMICPLSSRQVQYLKMSTDYTYISIEV